MMAAITANKLVTNAALLKFIFCLMPTNKNAAMVPTNEVMMHGNITSAGLVALSAAR